MAPPARPVRWHAKASVMKADSARTSAQQPLRQRGSAGDLSPASDCSASIRLPLVMKLPLAAGLAGVLFMAGLLICYCHAQADDYGRGGRVR